MKKILITVVALAGAYYAFHETDPVGQQCLESPPSNASLEQAIGARRAGHQVHGSGTILRILPDDNDGDRHQRFIVRLDSGRTLLVAHNIDLAPRVANLSPGENVSFFGEYEWNERGGVIHWTHHDPRAQHVDGWVEHRCQRYQ